jgi:hypothetical protein
LSIWPQAAKKDQNSLKAWRANELEPPASGYREVEDHAGDDEDDRRQPERERGDEAERVVDRRAHVAVGRREERVDAQDALQGLESPFRHLRRGSLGGG